LIISFIIEYKNTNILIDYFNTIDYQQSLYLNPILND